MKASNEISNRKARPGAPARNGASSSRPAERFFLDGPSLVLDPRIHAYRRDIADIALAGQLFAPHYARPVMRSCGMRGAFLRHDDSIGGKISSELLPGEGFAVLEYSGRMAWGYCRADHYVGYVEAIELADPAHVTHMVAAAAAPIYAEPDLQSPPLATLPMGARVAGREREGFLATDSGFIPFTHVRPIDAFEHDPVGVAERLTGSPYLFGGRTARGIDCSGLVQLALGLCGTHAPRDSDQQRLLGKSLPEAAELQRGDLIFFEGHVGLMRDAGNLIHATAHSGKVLVEPLEAVAARNPIAERRRMA